MAQTALITGANGYLGGVINACLEAAGWKTRALVRRPQRDRAWEWSLGDAPPERAMEDVDALIHCAYDFGPRGIEELRRVNVGGSEVLLRAATDHGIDRTLVLSSMSAYPGTKQTYGRIKLEIEAVTLRTGGIAIRPGLVYGENPQGMAGALRGLTRLPLVPVLGGTARQFPVHEEDLAAAVQRVLESNDWLPEVFGVAQTSSVSFRDLLIALASRDGRRCRFVRVPWKSLYLALLAGELARLPLPVRSDSLLGLVHPAPFVPSSAAFPGLTSTLRTLF